MLLILVPKLPLQAGHVQRLQFKFTLVAIVLLLAFLARRLD